MPIFKIGEMLRVPGIKIVTANSFLTMENKLAMGGGEARALRRLVPGIDEIFGRMILDSCGHLGIYGLLSYEKYGVVQVKRHFCDPADIDLIKLSIGILAEVANNERYIFHINYPGIAHDGLNKAEVGPILDILPNNVYVWEKG